MMRRFFLYSIILLVCGCSKQEESDIPYVPVYVSIDLRFQDRDLVGLYKYKEITAPRTANERTGYAGVLVVCGLDTETGGTTYYAYDLCCPHECKRNITVKADNAGKAVCPECGTEFDTGYGTGAPVKGVSRYPLRRYQAVPMSADRQEWTIVNMN